MRAAAGNVRRRVNTKAGTRELNKDAKRGRKTDTKQYLDNVQSCSYQSHCFYLFSDVTNTLYGVKPAG